MLLHTSIYVLEGNSVVFTPFHLYESYNSYMSVDHLKIMIYFVGKNVKIIFTLTSIIKIMFIPSFTSNACKLSNAKYLFA